LVLKLLCFFCFTDRWEQWIYPFASSIDTPLPDVPEDEQYHIFLDFKASHIHVPPKAKQFARYPDASLVAWHQQKQKRLNESKKE
jgi:hypothetical protein